MAFGYTPVDPPQKKVIKPVPELEPRIITAEGEITKIRQGTSTLSDLEKATKLMQHILEISHDSIEGLSSNHLSIWFTSSAIGRVHLVLFGTNDIKRIGEYQRFMIEYRDKLNRHHKLQYSFEEIDEKTFLNLQNFLDGLLKQ